MEVKYGLPALKKIKQIMESQHGVLRTSDLTDLKIPRVYLAMLEQNGEIERVSRGVYRAVDDMEDEWFSFQARYQSSVYSHETALYLHDLTDRTPLFYSLSVPSGYHSTPLNESGHKIFYVSRDCFELGVVTVKSPYGNEIRVTGLERTICDIVRSRNQVETQFVGEALKRYVVKKERNLEVLYQYAKIFRVEKIVRQYIEVLL